MILKINNRNKKLFQAETSNLHLKKMSMTQKMPIPEFQWKQAICATCEYWGGERELDFQNARLMYVRAQYCPQPKCAGARMNTSQGPTNRACPAYKRWHKLP